MLECVKRLDIVQTIKDVYIDGKIIPCGTKFTFAENNHTLFLSGFGPHLVIGVVVQSMDNLEWINLPLDCLNIAPTNTKK